MQSLHQTNDDRYQGDLGSRTFRRDAPLCDVSLRRLQHPGFLKADGHNCRSMSPVGPYYSTGYKPVSLLASTKDVRAWPGGTGALKLGSNYAGGVVPQ